MNIDTTFMRKAKRLLLVVFLINAVLVATHKGEFWPFSIYPMFSKAGKPWTRALLRDVTNTPDSIIWKTHQYPDLPGEVLKTADIGVDNIDYSNFLVKTKVWDSTRTYALRYMLGEEHLQNRRFLAIKVSGSLMQEGGVKSEALPYILFDKDGNHLNPNLTPESYNKP